jgi:mycoredoxin
VTSPSLTMYSTTWCGYCKRLKSQLDEAGIVFSEINIEEDPSAADFVEKINGGNQTVPTVVYSDGSAQTNPSIQAVIAKLNAVADENKGVAILGRD